MFINNNFGSSKNNVYQLLTYFNILKAIKNNESNDYFLILEHNVNKEFIKKIIENNNNHYDIIFFKNSENENENEQFVPNNIEIIDYDLNNSNNLISSYIINKTTASKIINFIEKNGFIEKDINYILQKLNLTIGISKEVLFNFNKKYINVQTNYEDESFDFKYLNKNNDYIFIPNNDHFGDDIIYYKDNSVDSLMYICDNNEEIIAFNTLGYLKHNINVNKLIKLNNEDNGNNNGIYIHIERFNARFNNSILNNNFLSFPNKLINDPNNEKHLLMKEADIKNTFKLINNSDEYMGFSTNGTIAKNANISLLKSCKDVNTFLDLNKYIKVNYVNFLMKNTFIKIVGEYLFIKGFDYENNDIHFNNNMKLNDMIKYANENEHIECFNSLGFFKNSIDLNKLISNNYINSGNNGLYVKINKIKNQLFKIKNANTLDKDYTLHNNNSNIIIEQNNESNNIIDQNNEYLAYHSSGFFKKELDITNFIFDNDIYNNYLLINVYKLYHKLEGINKNTERKRVKIICNWCTSFELCKSLNKVSMGYLYWNNIEFTYDDSFIDYFVIIDGIYEDTYYVKDKSILFTNNNEKIMDKFEYMNVIDYNIPLYWNINKSYIDLKYNSIEKQYNSLFIGNNKNELTEYINNKIIINKCANISKYKYALTMNKDDLWDGILNECLCFYCGDVSIFKYIDSNSIIILDKDIIKSYNQINYEMNNNLWETKIDFIMKDKLRILDEYNICSKTNNILSKILN